MRAFIIILVLVGGAASLGVGMYLGSAQKQTVEKGPDRKPTESTQSLKGSWALQTPTGKQVTADSLRGRWSLLYFGYTFCPDICPAELSLIGKALDGLGDDAKAIDPYFVTVDPDRDSLEKLSKYVPFFHEQIVPLWGNNEQIRACADEFEVVYSRANLANSDHYLINHTSDTFLLDPDGVIVERFPYQHPVQSMIDEIRTHLH